MFSQNHHLMDEAGRAFIGVLLLVTVFCMMPPSAFAATHSSPPPFMKTICKNTPIQPGWVVVDILTDRHRCEGSLLNPDNVWTITRATGLARVCRNSPIPQGFVVTAQDIDVKQCRALGMQVNTMTITPISPPWLRAFICASSPIPAGWVVIIEYLSIDHPIMAATCPRDAAATNLNGIIQRVIEPAVANTSMIVCPDSPLPQGYHSEQRIFFQNDCPFDFDRGSSLLIVPSSPSHWSV
jgi:hypothetical protein